MSSRRDALRILAYTSTLPVLGGTAQQTKEVETQPGHLHTGPATKAPLPSKPTFFQPEEFRGIEAMSERIIPRSDTPGAKDAGVPFRAGIADLNAVALTAYNAKFADLSEEQQITVLTPLSLEADSSLGKFFRMVKDMTVDAYYRTEAGLKTELGWQGKAYLAEFKGCTHPEHQS
jgi:hypothetical protein